MANGTTDYSLGMLAIKLNCSSCFYLLPEPLYSQELLWKLYGITIYPNPIRQTSSLIRFMQQSLSSIEIVEDFVPPVMQGIEEFVKAVQTGCLDLLGPKPASGLGGGPIWSLLEDRRQQGARHIGTGQGGSARTTRPLSLRSVGKSGRQRIRFYRVEIDRSAVRRRRGTNSPAGLEGTRLPIIHPSPAYTARVASKAMAKARTFCMPSQIALGPG